MGRRTVTEVVNNESLAVWADSASDPVFNRFVVASRSVYQDAAAITVIVGMPSVFSTVGAVEGSHYMK